MSLNILKKIHQGLRKAQKIYREKRGLPPAPLPWEIEGEPMDKIMNILPKGKGTKILGGLGIVTAILALVNDFTGAGIPGIAMSPAEALGVLWGSLTALYLRRAIGDKKPE